MSGRRFVLSGPHSSTRNLALVGHVDHGKSTYADLLLAANSIIRWSHKDSIRYLDSRDDEQERGITMESSAVSLSYRIQSEDDQGEKQFQDFLINLIDTPGHVDFSSEVSVASRLCEGVLVIVDAVEGVCTQTINVLREAWVEKLKPILVINKIDRLVLELKLSPLEAHYHLIRVVEQANAIIGALFASERMEADERWRDLNQDRFSTEADFVESDDSDLYFVPEKGNVIFASAVDGWAFRVQHFSKTYAARLGIREELLRTVLWGEHYLDPKTKRVTKRPVGSDKRALKPMFVQFVLENIWTVYQCVTQQRDSERISKIVTSLGLKIRQSELKSKDSRTLLVAIFSQWLPLASTTFRAIVDQIPSPAVGQRDRLPRLLQTSTSEMPRSKRVEEELFSADASEGAHVIAYVSKLFAVTSTTLPKELERLSVVDESQSHGDTQLLQKEPKNSDAPPASASDEADIALGSDETLLGLARLYSGTLRRGQTVRCVSPSYDPRLPHDHPRNLRTLRTTRVEGLFMLMGRDLIAVEQVPAGNIFALTGLAGKVLRNATLCSSGAGEAEDSTIVNLAGFSTQLVPIVKVALEPVDPSDLPKLAKGLRLLRRADPCVETFVQDSGEHVILTAGELHLERCLRDLRERFAKIEIQSSPPIVPFRETAIAGQDMPPPKVSGAPRGTAVAAVPDGVVRVRLRAKPLPDAVVSFLTSHSNSIRSLYKLTSQIDEIDDENEAVLEEDRLAQALLSPSQFWSQLNKVLESLGPDWAGLAKSICAFGPKRSGTNVLVWDSRSSSLPRTKAAETDIDKEGRLANSEERGALDVTGSGDRADDSIAESIFTGFQLGTLKGPLCAEPMSGLAFFVDEVTKGESSQLSTIATRHLIPATIDAVRQGLLEWSPRLMLAMYSCEIQATSEVLGKVYAVLSRRHGTIVSEGIHEGTSFFTIKALLPVVESFGFAEGEGKRDLIGLGDSRKGAEIRTRTSGAASPQLVFHGFDKLDQDPFWTPKTVEELEDFGDKADRPNLARNYMDSVRSRKGMEVQNRIIERADKQRTRKKD